MSWYYAEGTTQKGPVSDEVLAALVQAGTIRPETLVWREGMVNWQPYRTVARPVQAGAGAAAPLAAVGADMGRCAECGQVYPRKDMVAYMDQVVCAGCRDVFFQKVREGVATTGGMRYAGFWIRVGAKIIDSIVLWVINFIVQLPFLFFMAAAMEPDPETGVAMGAAFFLVYLLLMALQLGIAIGYQAFFLGKYGATPGKMALSLKVVRPDGAPVTAARGAGRGAAELLSGMILAIGYIMAGFDEEKRSLHDRICDTRVIRV